MGSMMGKGINEDEGVINQTRTLLPTVWELMRCRGLIYHALVPVCSNKVKGEENDVSLALAAD